MKMGRLNLRAATLGVATVISGMPGGVAWGTSLHDGLISYWRLNEGSGAVANDTAPAGGVADAGTLRNAPTWISGKFNAGLQFDGVSNQDVLIPNSTDMDINTSAVTLSAWVKLDQLPSEIAGSFSGIYDSGPDNYVLYLDKTNNELRFKATTATGVSTATAAHPGVRGALLNTTDWIHVMGVYDGDANRSKIYFNGQLADVTSHTGGAGILAGPVRAGQVAGIGSQAAAADPFAPSSLFKGAISDVAVWNRPLGLAEAQYLYNGGAGNAVGAANPNINPVPPIAPVLPTAQPVIYYKFNGDTANYGTGGSALDAVVHGPNAAAFQLTNYGSGLDLTANPNNTAATPATGVASSTDAGTYLSVNYKLTDNGTIAGRFSTQELFNWSTIWSNSNHVDDWEAWVYADGRVAARADRGSAGLLAHNLYQFADPSASHHYAFSWQRNGAEIFVQLFVDGELVDQRVGAWRDAGNTFFIGGGVPDAGTASNHYGKGIYDEFRIYSTALTEAEVLYLSQNAPETVPPAFAGDFNSDGFVNAADLTLWKVGFGKTTGALRGDGDADQDGDVDGADFLTWQREFGSGLAAPSAGAVPEPATALLATLGIGAALVVRRNRSQK